MELLLLDAAGVLVTETDAEIMADLAKKHGLEEDRAIVWNDEIAYGPFWSGQWSESDLAKNFENYFDVSVDGDVLMKNWRDSIVLLPAMEKVAVWSQKVPVWILSDHRADWLLETFGENTEYFGQLFISDQTGLFKPQAETFDMVMSYWDGLSNEVLFVDDKQRNLDAAKKLGMKTLLADPEQTWVNTVDQLLLDK